MSPMDYTKYVYFLADTMGDLVHFGLQIIETEPIFMLFILCLSLLFWGREDHLIWHSFLSFLPAFSPSL